MFSRLATRAPRALKRPLVQPVTVRCFAAPINLNMIDSDFNAPSSQTTLYKNEFIHQHPSKHAEDAANATHAPVVHDTKDLMPAHAGDPHNTYGCAEWRYVHYDVTREPTFPRKPDLSKGELASGAQVVRTDVWHDPKEPAISSVAKFDPNHFRPVGWAEHAPNPTSTCPEGTLDFRVNRLPLDHADRRPWLYFMSATTGIIFASLVRVTCCKLLHGMWPAKDVFAAGIVEVDLRPIEVGQNFTVKWRGKPVFILRRTPEMVELAKKDDPLVASMRDPFTDAEICKKPEYLIVVGVCTHLGCIPQPLTGNYGGYFCPCHGSHYDLAGRIRQGPAPTNLEVPPYEYLDEVTVKLG